MTLHTGLILVTGATGKQGGAVVRSLLEAGRHVRAMTRNPNSSAARALAEQGVEVVKGDFTDIASLDRALAGVHGVFSMQVASHPGDPDTEIVTGKALIDAAGRAGVQVVVHASVARAGEQESFIGWGEGRWEPLYWNNKSAVIDMVKTQGFPCWVILKPALFMEDVVPPMVDSMFGSLRERGRFETAIEADTGLDWIAADDIGAFAAAAFAEPQRFHGHEIDLAAELATLPAVAAKIASVTGKAVSSVTFSEEELVARGEYPLMVRSQVWDNVEGYKVDIEAVRSWGIPLTTLDQFIQHHRDEFVIGSAVGNPPTAATARRTDD